MLTHVHVGVALVGAALVAPHDWRVAALAGVGGFLPDLVIWIQLTHDVLRRRKPFAQCGRMYYRTYEIAHSMLLMLPTFIVPPLAWGIYSHLIVDMLTHRRRVLTKGGYERVNSYCWPLQIWWPHIFDCDEGKEVGSWAQLAQHAIAAALFVAFAVLEWR